jgi:hypothetical protein
VFVVLPRADAGRLRADGAAFHDWGQPRGSDTVELTGEEIIVRLVTAFSTRVDEVDAFLARLG